MPTTPEFTWDDFDQLAVDTGRVLAADAVQKVGNGHPGTAMSLSPLAYLLYHKVMRLDPADPLWLGRDRFVLSAGHSSLTQYIQLYLTGTGLELEDLESLRTWGSKTPGHPEYKHTDGIEITTGPLGQGLASAVGMAMGTRREHGLLDADTPLGESPFDHDIWVIASDGDLQEGVTSEASSLAGTQELGNLVVIWDDNQISIEDDTSIAFGEDVSARYRAYGWKVLEVNWRSGEEYHEDIEELYRALIEARETTDAPVLIRLRTIIGWPAPNKKDTGAIHGSALGEDEVKATKEILGFDPNKTFDVDPELISTLRERAAERGKKAREAWQPGFDSWAEKNPEGKKLLDRLVARTLPEDLASKLPTFEGKDSLATRAASGEVLNALAEPLPELWGGSADLAGSNNTTMKGEPSFLPADRSSEMFPGNVFGRTLHFGIREHAMGSILSGIALEGLTRPYGGTFLVFSDYMRAAVRLAALMGVPVTYVWTHDSIGLGEDGPTHQPVEHLTALRAIPNLDIVRPADATETAQAWLSLLKRDARPTGLILTRQNVPVLDRETYAPAEGVDRGGYILAEADGDVEVILLASGSEVQLALEARETLQADGTPTRVVSMPSMEWFDAQDAAYREEVLPPSVRARVSVEAGLAAPWRPYVGDLGRSVSLEHFGASADYETLYREFGITADTVVTAARESLAALQQED
ncbi:transketolase [Bowdeniella nasicola]|uniref:Transketolase n=1 Tax=Bowdeniella nasicola TaxID=208480 RepID=A0A1H4AT93_9ACTO|nr:transketolase [Bowdeniella nasicola]SEA39155.1 transketolase [Bowdeniella nasicola]